MSEEEKRVRCNWCTAEFDEIEITVRDDEEYCPKCGKSGCLMDLPSEDEK
jgi:hypothetical protein